MDNRDDAEWVFDLWGALIGLIFLMQLAGLGIGAASGVIGGGLAKVGIHDDTNERPMDFDSEAV